MSEQCNLNGVFDHVQIQAIPTAQIRPSPENDKLYRPVNADDPEIIALAENIQEHGILEPLIITADGFILSGHRRYAASSVAGLEEIPCRRLDITRDHPEFLKLLRSLNMQRVKTLDERLREEVVMASPEEAYETMIAHRKALAAVKLRAMSLRPPKKRSQLSEAKSALLKAVCGIVERLRDYWPLSDRQIHYQLLNCPPLIHTGKPGSRYRNDLRSYRALTDLLTRARHEGQIAHEVIGDTTRPVTTWDVYAEPGAFVRQELNGLLKGYWRDLQQSQPNHIEIVMEKLTVSGILRPVAEQFCLPMMVARGFCSTHPRHLLAERFRRSGKEKLVLLIASDLDPDGDEIAHSLAASLRDDFSIENIHPVKVALTREQVASLHLPASMAKAKKGSANYSRFVKRYKTDDVYELEAVEPAVLQSLLRQAIDGVMDLAAFNSELDKEKQDAAYLAGLQARLLAGLRNQGFAA
jgi:ParB-like nuclease domain